MIWRKKEKTNPIQQCHVNDFIWAVCPFKPGWFGESWDRVCFNHWLGVPLLPRCPTYKYVLSAASHFFSRLLILIWKFETNQGFIFRTLVSNPGRRIWGLISLTYRTQWTQKDKRRLFASVLISAANGLNISLSPAGKPYMTSSLHHGDGLPKVIFCWLLLPGRSSVTLWLPGLVTAWSQIKYVAMAPQSIYSHDDEG